jgi:hypothetical protein
MWVSRTSGKMGGFFCQNRARRSRRGRGRLGLFLEALETRVVPSGPGPKPTGLAVLLMNDKGDSDPVSDSDFQNELKAIANPYISGVALQIDWKDIEPDTPIYGDPNSAVPTNLELGRLNQLLAAAKDAGNKWVQLDIFAGSWSPKWVLDNSIATPDLKRVKTAQFDVPYGGQLPGASLPLPLPWDTNYLNDYGSFMKAIGVVYGGNPDFRVIAADGPTSVSAEFTEPATKSDLAMWKKHYQYTFNEYIGAWSTIFSDYQTDFPNQYVSLAHGYGMNRAAFHV